MYAPVATKAAEKGDQIQGMSVIFATGYRWDGEFTAVYGDRKVSDFLRQCTGPVSQVFFHLEGGEVAHTTFLGALMRDS